MASEQSAATLSILATDSGSALAKFAIAIEARWRLMAARSDPPPPPVAVPAEVALDGRTYCGRLLMDHNIHANVNLHDAPNVLYCWFFGFARRSLHFRTMPAAFALT